MKIFERAVGRIELRRMPWAVLVLAVLLTVVGALFIRSAHSYGLARKHLIFAGIGVAAFFCMAFLDYRHLGSMAIPLYFAGLISLALLPFFGARIRGVRRWYDLGLVLVQPSEPMKLILVIALADYFSFKRNRSNLRGLIAPLVLTLLPMALIIRQPDFGTAMLFLPLFFAMAFLAGVPVRNLLIVVVVGTVLFACAWFVPGVLKDYQRNRLMSFIDPERDPQSNASYNAQQAILAINSGGLHGRGWGEGHLNRLGRIPERHTDFIFPVIAEEWGFIKTSGVVCLYLILMALLGLTTLRARDAFSRLVAGGVLTLFSVQSLLHMAISLRLAPITGLTLPLVSYGGSSLVTTFAALGLSASVAIRKTFIFPEEE